MRDGKGSGSERSRSRGRKGDDEFPDFAFPDDAQGGDTVEVHDMSKHDTPRESNGSSKRLRAGDDNENFDKFSEMFEKWYVFRASTFTELMVTTVCVIQQILN